MPGCSLAAVSFLLCSLPTAQADSPFQNFVNLPAENVSCKWNPVRKFHIPVSVVVGLCCAIGLFQLLCAIHFYFTSLYIFGFLMGGTLTYMIVSTELVQSQAVYAAESVGGAMACAFLLYIVPQYGNMFVGFGAGMVVDTLALAGVSQLLVISDSAKYLSMAVVASAAGFLTMWFKRVGFIVAACLLGASLVVTCVDYFVEDLYLVHFIKDLVFFTPFSVECLHTWVILGTYPLLAIIGAVLQITLSLRWRRRKQPLYEVFTRTLGSRAARRSRSRRS